MNERIEILSDYEVRIKRSSSCVTPHFFKAFRDGMMCQGIGSQNSPFDWDALGQSALRDCLNCLEATGGFAALADTSAVPWVGKRMRCKSHKFPIELFAKASDGVGDRWYAIFEGGNGTKYDSSVFEKSLLPLIDPAPPKPVGPQTDYGKLLDTIVKYVGARDPMAFVDVDVVKAIQQADASAPTSPEVPQ